MKWLNEFKLALINEDILALDRLINEFSNQNFNIDEALEAATLTNSAIELFKSKKITIQNKMQELKNIKKYVS